MLESLVGIHWRRMRGYLRFEGVIRVVPSAYLRFEGLIRVVPNAYLRFEGLVPKYKWPKNRMIPLVFRRSYFGYRVLAPP